MWITLCVLAAVPLAAGAFCVVAPLDVWGLMQRYSQVHTEGRLRWGWGAVSLAGTWELEQASYRLAILGREVPRRWLDPLFRRIGTWWKARETEPFDWRGLLTRERVAEELQALRAGADRFESSEEVGQLGMDTVDLVVDLASSLGLRSRIDLRVALEDPFALGMVWAAGAVVASMLPPGSFRLSPAFNGDVEDTLEGEMEVSGRLLPIPLAWLAIRFVFTRSGRRCLRAVWSWWWYPRAVAEASAR